MGVYNLYSSQKVTYQVLLILTYHHDPNTWKIQNNAIY